MIDTPEQIGEPGPFPDWGYRGCIVAEMPAGFEVAYSPIEVDLPMFETLQAACEAIDKAMEMGE